MNEKKEREEKEMKNNDLKSKDEPTACTHSTPHSDVRHFLAQEVHMSVGAWVCLSVRNLV